MFKIAVKTLVLIYDRVFLCQQDTLILRYLEVNETKVTLSPDHMQLKLSQKYFKLFGAAFEGQESVLCQSSVGIGEEIVSFVCGKEFSFLQTADGKVELSLITN